MTTPQRITMTNLTNQVDPSDIDNLENEGEKVTGGSDSGETNTANPKKSSEESAGKGELLPEEESKKEEMTGYNEHPDQEKVGGG
jgi:hypothetical protein